MRLFSSLLLFLFFAISSAQEIVVLDRESGQPIFNVAVFNKDKSKSLLTGFDGEANLSVFSSGEIIFFRHIAHAEFHSTKRQILQRGNKIYLEPTKNELSEVVLSVSKFEQDKKLVPQKVVTINQKEILSSAPQTSADFLKVQGRSIFRKVSWVVGAP